MFSKLKRDTALPNYALKYDIEIFDNSLNYLFFSQYTVDGNDTEI